MGDNTLDKFKLNGKICVVTGGAGFLGRKHDEAILDADGIPVLLDIDEERINKVISELKSEYKKDVAGFSVDITNKSNLEKALESIIDKFGRVDVLINNATNDPKVDKDESENNWSRFENFSEEMWNNDIDVSVKGAFLCSQVFGAHMARNQEGVILNMSSDLGVIAPDQRIYEQKRLSEEDQPVKPVTYSVAKHALLGLTKYLAIYWAKKGLRVNALCPGGVYKNQDDEFVKKLTNLIPMGRMANENEYKAAILFLISDASSYMTGSALIIDGGRTCW